jgi:ABC-type antimicrobial peptide transport system permease subunit
VDAVALGWHAPVSTVRATSRVTISGSPGDLQTRYDVVGPDYFKTLGITVRSGREFDTSDGRDAAPVAIINDVLASRLTGDPLGQTLRVSGETAPRRVVGVVREIKYNGIVEPAQPFFYLPLAQAFRQEAYVFLRTRQPAAESMLRSELKKLDPNVALADVRTLSRQVDDARETSRASALAASGAAALAVVLALVGMYGVLMTVVEQRHREFAIRSALGASPAAIVGEVVRQGLVMTAVGIVIGMIASVQAGRFVASLLFEVAPRDAMVMLMVPVAVVMVSALAWWAPARRAAHVDPATSLKS